MTFLQNWENTLELQVEALLASFEDNIHGSVVFCEEAALSSWINPPQTAGGRLAQGSLRAITKC